MVEKIVQKESDETGTEKNLAFKLPKHIKQIGMGGNTPEIYIEDYAEGYLKRLTGNNESECRVAVLVGEFVKSEGKRYVFIRGAIEAEDVVIDNKVRFTSEAWAGVYEKIKRYFPYYEAVGWFLGGPGFLTEITEEIKQLHVDWFGGRDRVLFRMDPVERELGFYLYDKGELTEWPGYCVYYEKNEEMQDYLVAGAPPSVDAGYEEPILEELGKKVGRIQEPATETAEPAAQTEEPGKPEGQKEKKQEKSKSGHGASVAAAVALLAIGAFALRQRELTKNGDTAGLTPVPTVAGLSQSDFDKEVLQTNAEVKPTDAVLPEKELEGSFYERDFIPVTESPSVSSGEEGEKSTPTPAPTATPVPTMTPTPVPTATPAPTATPKEEEETHAGTLKLYIVQSGDTLAGICRSFYGDTSRLEEIKGLNQIPDENWIFAGQELYLP
ncbi:MAG: LysM peptidoglycan-binding domain-containing protein [Lachnospiraceae bacterium]|nr:LysM peptidoglycan-binding domain-containing protein [Lachnospiraceae bacterium]